MMTRYLLVSSLDVKRQPNNREHHIVRHIATRFPEALVVYRIRNDANDKRSRFSQLFLASARMERSSAGIRYLGIDPLLNSPPNMALDQTGSYSAGRSEAPRENTTPSYLFLNGLGILKDLSFIFFAFVFILIKHPARFDVGVGMGPFGHAVVYLLEKLGRIRCRIYEDRDYEVGFFHHPARRNLVEWLEIHGVRSASQVISIGHRLATLRKEQTGRSVTIVPTGVDLSRYQTRPRLNANGRRLIYIGNITYWSGLETIIESLAILLRTEPEATLSIVGEGLPGYQEHLSLRTRQLGIHQSVFFTGRVANTEIPSYLLKADIGIAVFQPIPLRAYAFPLKLLEYMAAGLPIIALRGTETEDVVTRHDLGLSVDLNADDLAQAYLQLIADPSLYHRFSQNCAEAVKMYDWTKLMDEEYQVVQQLCRARTKNQSRKGNAD